MEARPPRFTEGSTLRHVTVMSLTGSLGLSFMFLIDVATLYWVSVLEDPTLIAGVGLAAAVQFFNVAFGIGFAIAATALVSRSLGAWRREEARSLAAASLVYTAICMSVLAALVVAFRMPLIGLLGAEPGSTAVAQRFLLIAVPSLPLLSLGMVSAAILRAEGDALRAMLVTMAAGAVAMVLDPVLILVLGLGVDGAAWGMVASRGASAALGLWFAISAKGLVARPRRAEMRRHAGPFFAIAGPAVLTQLSNPFGNFVLTGVIAGFGDAAVAAWTVVGRLTILAFGGLFALAGSIGGILGQNYGAGLIERVRSAYRDALIYCLAYTLAAWALLAAASALVIRLFHVPQAGATVVEAFMTGAAGTFVFVGGLFVANATFNSLGRPLWSTGLNWLRDGILAGPFAIALSMALAAPGVVWGQAAAGIVAGTLAALLGWRFVSRQLRPPAAAAFHPAE